MQTVNGTILSGQFDETENVFTLESIKSFYTVTTLNEKQIQNLSSYLEKHQADDGQVVSLFDQLLIRLSKEEVKSLLNDLTQIESLYHD
ncbi:hypothetical protein M3182_01230 [Mesobacillus maritimus]|uniref:hypothetical protein n=1 Tax=Mesobacillus maritimus TaxID=1643336 RepID=UPI0020419111|nr:hypothetical protein [Mesobacillus maritimus]MCM3584362.1 hypothetical protein [Mesobacillus maritimus]